jgi:hypothetical protein
MTQDISLGFDDLLVTYVLVEVSPKIPGFSLAQLALKAGSRVNARL